MANLQPLDHGALAVDPKSKSHRRLARRWKPAEDFLKLLFGCPQVHWVHDEQGRSAGRYLDDRWVDAFQFSQIGWH